MKNIFAIFTFNEKNQSQRTNHANDREFWTLFDEATCKISEFHIHLTFLRIVCIVRDNLSIGFSLI